jgi:methionyl aminopeptidase
MERSAFDSYVKAGEIAKQVKDFARDFIEPGMKLIDIAEAIDSKIVELGGDFAFPVGLGVNEVAAHYTPRPDSEEVAEGILKVDVGVAVDGYIADTAFSIDLTEDGRFKDLIEFNEGVLLAATEVVRDGMRVSDIGDAVHDFVLDKKDERFVVVKSLCGHSLDRDIIHTAPNVSNHKNDNHYVFDDNAFAVEPFCSMGTGEIIEGKMGGIYVLKKDRRVRDRDAMKVIEYVKKNFKTRPFCERYLVRAGFTRLKFVLSTLIREGVLYEYPILLEKSRKPVSQAENTFVVANGEVVCTTG